MHDSMLFSLSLLFILSHLTGVRTTCDVERGSVVRVTRLSTTAASLEFVYLRQDGFPMLSFESEPNIDIFVNSQLLNELKISHDLLLLGLEANQTGHCFRILGDGLFVCSNITSTVETVPQLNHSLNSNDPTEVSFQWTVDTPVETVLYCTEGNVPLITHKTLSDASTTAATLTEFKPATQYTCYISARSTNGVGDNSSVSFETIPRPPYDLTATSIEPNRIHLTWLYDHDGDHVFIIQTVRGCSENAFLDRTNVNTFTLSSLTPFTLYCITVKSELSVDATSSPSPTLRVRTLEIAPGRVRNLMATPTSTTTVLVSWSEPLQSNGIITEYLVEVNSSNQKSVIGSTTSFSVSDLDPCSTYTLRVAARTSAGQGVWTSVSAQTLNPVPAVPQLLVIDRQRRNARWTISTPIACVDRVVITFEPVFSLEEPVSVSHLLTTSSGTRSTSIPNTVRETETYYVNIRSYGPGGISDLSPQILSTPILIDRQMTSRTNYIQIRFVGVGNCLNWTSTISSQNVTEGIKNRLSSICPQYLPFPAFGTGRLTCDAGGVDQVLYQTPITVESDQFSLCLEHWYVGNSPFLKVSDRVLLIDHSCNQLYIGMLSDSSCIEQICSASSAVAGSLIGGMLVGALLSAAVVTIVVLVCCRRRIFQRNTKKSGVGSCTVLDTIGTTTTTYMPKKSKPKSPQLAGTQTSVNTLSSDENYETLPYLGDDVQESEYIDRVKPNTHMPVVSTKKKTKSTDSDYEIPEVFIADRQKALSAAAISKPGKKPEYDTPEGVEHAQGQPSTGGRQHVPASQKFSLPNQFYSGNSTPVVASGSTNDWKTSTVPSPQPEQRDSSTLPTKAKPLMPAVSSKSIGSTLPSSDQAENGAKKKMPLLPKSGKGVAKNAKPAAGVASKAQLLESVFGGGAPPKPKPKPKDKAASNIECSGNTAYEKWTIN